MTVHYGFFRSKGPRFMGNSSKRGRPIEARIRVNCQWHTLPFFTNYSAPDLAYWLDVGESTAHRWVQNQRIPDTDKVRLLCILAAGEMPWRGWEQWRVCPESGQLIAPNGYSFMPGELAWLALIKEQNRELQRKVSRLEQEKEALRLELESVTFSQNENAPETGNLVYFPDQSGA